MPRNITIKNLSAVKAAREALPAKMRPQKVNGKWRKPELSARHIALLKKDYLRAGKEWKWDIPKKQVVKQIELKGHKRHLRARERQEHITKCMARMPKLIAEYRERTRKRRAQKEGLAAIFQNPIERDASIFRRVDE